MNKKFGKIILANDASTLSNLGFEQSPDAATFAINIANWFTGGRPGKFHSYSDPDRRESESALAQTMTQAGHTWTVGYDIPENVDAIFTHETTIDDPILRDLVNAGGSVYLAADTEDEDYATGYEFNWFLWEVGLQFKEGYNGISGNQPINSEHPIFAGVKSLYQRNGSSIIDFQPDEQANQILVSSSDGEGLYAILDLSKATPHVRINRIFSDGSVKSTEADEYIAIVNESLVDIDISGWKIQGINRNQEFYFPTGTVLKKGAECRVYTNEVHPESGGFSFGSKRSVWNNSSDEGRLYDAQGNLMSSYAYTEQSQMLSNLTKSLGYDNLILEADPEAIKAQQALGGKVTFEEALTFAYDSFEADNTEEGSAVDAIAQEAAAVGVPYAYFNGDHVSSAYHYMQKPTTKITLCTPQTPMLPTRGESIEANWIFMLQIPELNTVHWAIIDRSGEEEVYNYGCNLS
ncbi:lamin tail domain-containing protein [Allocoleopsis franciscana]|uniref:Intermediate filament tail domain protein n=1 Tax=Allocoleopsis franciscana PCC 7113 TaxID=1173027 RepID=K9WGB0_9CYAN|nr:lamin tail domain-containing protein [Allocoleopsis franciscana]AFZ19228.1 Intermediate filament tail domain protein [Allocoleopsis franciscana PCC 7113]